MALIHHTSSLAVDVDQLRSHLRSSVSSIRATTQQAAFACSALHDSGAPPAPLSESVEASDHQLAGYSRFGCGTNDPPCGKGWPVLWFAILLSYAPLLVSELVIVNVALTFFGGGPSNPCGDSKDGERSLDHPLSRACVDALSKVADAQSVSITVSHVISFIFAPIANVMADRMGRKPVLIIAGLLTMAQAAALVSAHYGCSPYWWYAAMILPGLVPANVGWGAVLADRTTPETRALVYSLLMAGEKFDGIVLPLVVSVASGQVCSWMSVIAMAIMFLFIIFFMPETMPPERRNEIRLLERERNEPKASRFAGMRLLYVEPKMRILTIIVFTYSFVLTGTQAIILLFYKANFGLGQKGASPLFSVYYGALLIMNLFLLQPLVRLSRPKALLVFSYVMWTGYSVSMFFAETRLQLYAIQALACFAFVSMPSFALLFHNAVAPELRAQVVGAVVQLQHLGRAIGPLVYCQFFKFFVKHRGDFGRRAPGFPFLLGAGLQVISLLVIVSLSSSRFSLDDENFAEERPEESTQG